MFFKGSLLCNTLDDSVKVNQHLQKENQRLESW